MSSLDNGQSLVILSIFLLAVCRLSVATAEELDSDIDLNHFISKRAVVSETDSGNCSKLNNEDKKMVLKRCPSKGIFPVVNQCEMFLKCLGKGTVPEQTCCPSGFHFDHIMRECMPKGYANCINACPAKGIVYFDPKNRFGYLKCTGLKIPMPFECPKNHCFDIVRDSCQPLTSKGCSDANMTYVEPKQTGRMLGSCRQPKQQELNLGSRCKTCVCQTPTMADECRLYKKCFGQGKKPSFSCCPSNEHFDHILRRCVPAKTARCKNVCPRTGIKFANPRSSAHYMMCASSGYPEVYACEVGASYHPTKKECIAGLVVEPKKKKKTSNEGTTENPNEGPTETPVGEDLGSTDYPTVGEDFPPEGDDNPVEEHPEEEPLVDEQPTDSETQKQARGDGDQPTPEEGMPPDEEVQIE